MRFLYSVFLLLSIFFLSIQSSFAKDNIDSLETELKSHLDDTTGIRIRFKLFQHYMKSDSVLAREHLVISLEKAEALKEDYFIGKTYSGFGFMFYLRGEIDKALRNHEKAVEYWKKIDNKKEYANTLNNIGLIYDKKGDFKKAIETFEESRDINIQINDSLVLAFCYNNLGNVYIDLGDYVKTLECFFMALEIHTRKKADNEIAKVLNNIGNVYNKQKEYDKALDYFNRSLEIKIKEDDQRGISISMNNIGNVLEEMGKYEDALEKYNESLEIKKKIGTTLGPVYSNIASVLYKMGKYDESIENGEMGMKVDRDGGFTEELVTISAVLGKAYAMKGNFSKAEQILQEGLNSAKDIRHLEGQLDLYEGLARLYEKTGQFNLAYENQVLYSQTRDSIFSDDKSKDIGKLEARHEIEIANIEKMQMEAEAARLEAERIFRRNLLQNSAVFVGIVAIILILVFSARFSLPKKVIEGGIFLIFLIVFEFIMVFIGPTIDNLANNQPAYQLLANAAVALMIFPLHEFLESRMKKRLLKTES